MRNSWRAAVLLLTAAGCSAQSFVSAYPATPEVANGVDALPLGDGHALLVSGSVLARLDPDGVPVQSHSFAERAIAMDRLSDGRVVLAFHFATPESIYSDSLVTWRSGELPRVTGGLAWDMGSGEGVQSILGFGVDGNDRILATRLIWNRWSRVWSDAILVGPDGTWIGKMGLESGSDGCCGGWSVTGFPAGGFGLIHAGELRTLGSDGSGGWTLSLPGAVIRQVQGRVDGRLSVLAESGGRMHLLRLNAAGALEDQWVLASELVAPRLARDVASGVTLTGRLDGGTSPDWPVVLHLDDAGAVQWAVKLLMPGGVTSTPEASGISDGGTLVAVAESVAGGIKPWLARMSSAGELPPSCSSWTPWSPAPPTPSALTATLGTSEGMYDYTMRSGGRSTSPGALGVVHEPACLLHGVPGEVGAPGGIQVQARPAPMSGELVVRFAHVFGATAYNMIGGDVGTWRSGAPIACGIRSWTEVEPGLLETTVAVPPNTWFVVTSSNDVGEGTAGTDSFGLQRSLDSTWVGCGPDH